MQLKSTYLSGCITRPAVGLCRNEAAEASFERTDCVESSRLPDLLQLSIGIARSHPLMLLQVD